MIRAQPVEHMRAADAAQSRIQPKRQTIRGFWTYFSLGTLNKAVESLDKYTYTRMKRWLRRKYPKGKNGRKTMKRLWPTLSAQFTQAKRPPKRRASLPGGFAQTESGAQ